MKLYVIIIRTQSLRVQELCESRLWLFWAPRPNEPYGFCGATLNQGPNFGYSVSGQGGACAALDVLEAPTDLCFKIFYCLTAISWSDLFQSMVVLGKKRISQ